MFYPRLKDLREDCDLSQEEIAKKINTSQSYYAQYENGKQPITFERVIELAKYYQVSIDYIAGLTNDKRGISRSELPEDETELLKKFRELSERQKGIIIGQIKEMTAQNEEAAAKMKDII